MAEVPSGTRAGEDCRKEKALVDLETGLVTLQAALLGGNLLRRWHQTRNHAACAYHQLLDTHEAGARHGQCVVDGIAVTAQEPHAGIARASPQ